MNMPKSPKFSLAMIGPGIVLIAMGLGSGEFIIWPYLVAQFGFGVIWGAILGMILQYFISNESGRYTLATGNSVYHGLYKLGRWIPFWFIVSTFASFAWPGIIGSGGKLFSFLVEREEILGINVERGSTVLFLLVIGLILTFGGKVYNNLERLQKLFIALSLPILIAIFIVLVDSNILNELFKGSIGSGDGYWFIPSGISLVTFVGAIAYSGAAGNLVLSHSFYVQDEGLGMAKNLNSQIELGKEKKKNPEGKIFKKTESNFQNFRKWFKNTSIEQFFSFFLTGLTIILLLVVISYALLYPYNGEEGLEFILMQSEILSDDYASLVGQFFLIIGVIFMFTTQLGVFETTSRIMTENLQLASSKIRKKYRRSNVFFFFLWSQILTAIFITLLNISQPLEILIISTFFSAISMFALSGFVLWLNTSKLIYKEIKPRLFRISILWCSFIFFGIFVIYTIYDLIKS